MIPSVIRTWGALLAGLLLSLPLVGPVASAVGFDRDQVAAVLVAVLAAAWHAAVRWTESRWPRAGVLLGRIGASQYPGQPVPMTMGTRSIPPPEAADPAD